MKKMNKKKVVGSISAVMLLSYLVTPLVDAAPVYQPLPDDYEIVRVTNPDNGVGEVDGLLSPDMPNYNENLARGQSYAWSAIDYKDYIYIGTCYNPISGIFYRTVNSALQQLGFSSSDATQLADSLIKLMYDDHFLPYENQTVPIILKINKKTWEATIVQTYAPTPETGAVAGFRNVVEFDGKLYFVAMSFPSSTLIEIDPQTDTSRVAFKLENTNPLSSGGIRGITVHNGELVMSVSNQDGIKIFKSKTPSDSSSWFDNVVADQQTFNNLPAYYNIDSINGGAIWDMIEFNGNLYVSMVTGKTDLVTGVNAKRGFALYEGVLGEDGTYQWQAIIGDTEGEGIHKAIYPFGLGVDASCAGNIFVYNDYLYIGGYNDPMLDLATIPGKGDFSKLYNDLKNPANLYRLDKNNKIEMVIGDADEFFTEGGIGTVSDVEPGKSLDGFGNPMNQYIWRMGEWENKLYIGTYDTTSITSPFFQLTNGNLEGMTKEDFLRRLNQLRNLTQDLIASFSKDSNLVSTETEGTSASTSMQENKPLEGQVTEDGKLEEEIVTTITENQDKNLLVENKPETLTDLTKTPVNAEIATAEEALTNIQSELVAMQENKDKLINEITLSNAPLEADLAQANLQKEEIDKELALNQTALSDWVEVISQDYSLVEIDQITVELLESLGVPTEQIAIYQTIKDKISENMNSFDLVEASIHSLVEQIKAREATHTENTNKIAEFDLQITELTQKITNLQDKIATLKRDSEEKLLENEPNQTLTPTTNNQPTQGDSSTENGDLQKKIEQDKTNLNTLLAELDKLELLLFDEANYKEIADMDSWNLAQKDRVEVYQSIVEFYKATIQGELPEEQRALIDQILLNEGMEQFIYYFAISDLTSNAIEGFDFFVSEDGVNFVTISRDGLGDPHNHGVRTLTSTKEGLFIGTANPFFGAQVYLLRKDGTIDVVEPENPNIPETPNNGEERNEPSEGHKVVTGIEEELVNLAKPKVSSRSNKIELTKPSEKKLPQTGEQDGGLLTFIGLMMSAIGSAFFLGTRQKKKTKKDY